MVLVKEQMQLIKRGARDLPVMFLVHVAKRYGIGQDLIEVFGARSAYPLIERDREFGDFAVWLDFGGMLMLNRPGFFRACFQLIVGSVVLIVFGAHGYLS